MRGSSSPSSQPAFNGYPQQGRLFVDVEYEEYKAARRAIETLQPKAERK